MNDKNVSLVSRVHRRRRNGILSDPFVRRRAVVSTDLAYDRFPAVVCVMIVRRSRSLRVDGKRFVRFTIRRLFLLLLFRFFFFFFDLQPFVDTVDTET